MGGNVTEGKAQVVASGKTWTAEDAGDAYVLRIQKNGNEGLSASGKNRIVASSHGGVKLGEMTLNLNVYVKA